jgi:hypothetical protein
VDNVLLQDSDWEPLEAITCRVTEFTPLGFSKAMPYASIKVESPALAEPTTGFVTHKLDFKHLSQAFSRSESEPDTEVQIIWWTKGWRYLKGPSEPRMEVSLNPKNAYELMYDDGYKPELQGEERWRAGRPIAEWSSQKRWRPRRLIAGWSSGNTTSKRVWNVGFRVWIVASVAVLVLTVVMRVINGPIHDDNPWWWVAAVGVWFMPLWLMILNFLLGWVWFALYLLTWPFKPLRDSRFMKSDRWSDFLEPKD